MSQPQSSAAEALRLLRTNLDFASASGEIDKLVITSPGPGEGKSTIAANLGVVMAQAGVKTVIIDADLRKPTLNRLFGVPNDRGLTTLLTHPDESWQDYAKKVALPGLFLIPSGPIPPNPSDLVSSDRFKQLLARVQEDVDLVLIDSPPILSASDSLAIATYADGMMLVCRSHHTRIDALRHASHAAHQGGIRLVGVVINRLKGQQGASYYGEYYGSAAATGD
jgi:capsular exopolysaccharide synthesis family protein